MSKKLVRHLDARIAAGAIQIDGPQRLVAERLGALADELATWRPLRGGVLSGLFGSKGAAPRGLYIHGAVGRGKTMLMDLFAEHVDFKPRRRIHFHPFMAEVHDLIARARKRDEGDPMPYVAKKIARSAGLLCFDELHVTDIADAMILGRLFTQLFERKTVVVATSNVPPGELYKNGLNRQLFLPFIGLIAAHMDVLELNTAKDFRLEKLAGQPLYFSPLGPAADRAMQEAFARLSGTARGAAQVLDVKGRALHVPEAALGVARFPFDDLCDRPLGSLDYLEIARNFHTVLIEDIPVLTPDKRAQARRFINLIDTLYDSRVGLVASAAAEPHALYPAGDGVDLFQRTASRLIEMRSEAYLAARGDRNGAVPAAQASAAE